MSQTVPATAVLGPGKTGLAIGLRVLNLDGTEYSAFSTTDVAETSTAGTYRKASGVVVPDAGGYIVWGVSGTDYAEATVGSTSANVTTLADGALIAIADAILTRDFSAVTGAASRSLLNAVRFLRNRWFVSGPTLTVTEEDDTTAAWTALLTTDETANPITGSDPG